MLSEKMMLVTKVQRGSQKPRVPKELSCFGTGSSRVRWGSFMATD